MHICAPTFVEAVNRMAQITDISRGSLDDKLYEMSQAISTIEGKLGLTPTSGLTHGVNPNGLNPNGVNPNGVDPNGVNPNVVNTNGVNTNGVDPNGVNPNEVNPNGVNPWG